MLLVVGGQVEGADLCALGVNPALEQETHRGLLGRQTGAAFKFITACEVAFGRQCQLIQLQGVWQFAAGFELGRGDGDVRGQILGQRLQGAAQVSVQVACTVSDQIDRAAHMAVNLQRQRPRLVVLLRQIGRTLQGHRPVTHRLQQARQLDVQVFTLDARRVDLQPLGCPLGGNLYAFKLLNTVKHDAAHFHHPDFDRHGQLQIRQLNRPAAVFFTRGKLQVDLVGLQLIDAQGHAHQARRRPGENRPTHFDTISPLLPHQLIGAPLRAQAASKVVNVQAGYLRQRPAATRLRAQNGSDADNHQQH